MPRSTRRYAGSYQILRGRLCGDHAVESHDPHDPLDGRPHLDARIRLPVGDSRGRWEDVLVVETTNFNDDTWVLGHGGIGEGRPSSSATTGHGIVHSPELRVVELFPWTGTIRYEATIEDRRRLRVRSPSRSTPWSGEPSRPSALRVTCHEGNREGILLATGVDIDPSQK